MKGWGSALNRAVTLTRAQRRKSSLILDIAADLPDNDRALAWVTAYVTQTHAEEHQWLKEVAGTQGAEYLMSWNEGSWEERGLREGLRADIWNVIEAEKALASLRFHFGVDPRLRYDSPHDGPSTREKSFQGVFSWLEGRLKGRRSNLETQLRDKTGNYASNRAAFVHDIWPALKDDGFSMNAAARIIAKAFEQAGLESGDLRRRQEAIRQTIRNASL